MEGVHTFDLRLCEGKKYFIVTDAMIQNAIDAINSAVKDFPDAWEFVRRGELLRENSKVSDIHPLAEIIFNKMAEDEHTGFSGENVLYLVTMLIREKGLEIGLNAY
jgi:hypothetical protein